MAAKKEKKKKKGGGDGGGEGHSTGGQVAELTMEDYLWGNGSSPTVEEREEIETDWSIFYGQQLQRQPGPAFQFSGDFLGSGKFENISGSNGILACLKTCRRLDSVPSNAPC